MFALFKVKNLVQVFGFRFWKSRSPSRKKNIKRTFFNVKTVPISLRNILGPVFNFDLDQFLTLKFCHFAFWLKPLFLECFQQRMQKKKTHKKKTQTLFGSTLVLTAVVKMSVFCIFHIGVFGISNFREMFLDGWPKLKKITKTAKTKKQQKKTRWKAKTNQILWLKTKQGKKQKKTKKTSWNTNKQNKNNKQEPEIEMRNRDSF